MNSRIKQLGASFGGSKRNSNKNRHQPSLSPSANGLINHTPAANTSSTSSLSMNQQNGLGRPPSYTHYPLGARSASPLPPTSQQAMTQHPPPINTGAYSQGHPALAGAPQPPSYGGSYNQPNGIHSAPQPVHTQYSSRGQAFEVEGAGRSKAQLIVGIDFVDYLVFPCIFYSSDERYRALHFPG